MLFCITINAQLSVWPQMWEVRLCLERRAKQLQLRLKKKKKKIKFTQTQKTQRRSTKHAMLQRWGSHTSRSIHFLYWLVPELRVTQLELDFLSLLPANTVSRSKGELLIQLRTLLAFKQSVLGFDALRRLCRRRFIGMMHRVSPVRMIWDRFNDSPGLARRTHPAPSSSQGTCCCWWWWCWGPGAAGGETEKLLRCWVFATCSNYQAVLVWIVSLLLFLSGFVSILSVSCRELSRVSQNKALFPPKWTFFLSGRRYAVQLKASMESHLTLSLPLSFQIAAETLAAFFFLKRGFPTEKVESTAPVTMATGCTRYSFTVRPPVERPKKGEINISVKKEINK